MATVNGIYRASGTLTASTVEIINLTGRGRQVTITNRGTGDIFVTTNGATPAGGGEEAVVPSNTSGGPFWTEPVQYQRTDSTSIVVTTGSSVVADPSILVSDQGALVTGTGIPANSFVGKVTEGVGFVLTDQNAVAVLATATQSASVIVNSWRSVIRLFSTGTPAYTVG